MGSQRECTRILGLEGFRVETITWDGEAVYDQLVADGSFAKGALYGFHINEVPGGNLTDIRSYTGTFGDGSLQIVVSANSLNFYADVDRFNPYQDLVKFFGHTFLEVLPGLFHFKW